MPSNMWFACPPLPLALTRTALEQNGARDGNRSAPFFGTCALPLLERRGARTCRGLGVMHGPSKGGPAQWAAAQARAVTDTEVGWWLPEGRARRTNQPFALPSGHRLLAGITNSSSEGYMEVSAPVMG